MKGIRSVRLEHFRGVREGGVDGLVDVNILVGRNNSGKTTIAEALCYWAGAEVADATGQQRRSRWERARSSDTVALFQFLSYRGDTTLRPIIEATFDGTGEAIEHSWQHLSLRTVGLDRPDYKSGLTPFFPQDLLRRDIERQLWPAILQSRADKLLAAELSKIFRINLEGVQLLPDGRAMLLFPDYGLPIDTQGDGARGVFRCLTVLATMKDTMFILEEPECHQHPGSLGRFAEAVCSMAAKRSVQLLLTTHSLECVRAFLVGAELAGTTAKLFNLELNDGVLKARDVSAAAAKGLDASGVDLRELDLYA